VQTRRQVPHAGKAYLSEALHAGDHEDVHRHQIKDRKDDEDGVDVELVTDGTERGEDYDDDTLGSSGEFSISSFTCGGSTDTDYDFNVSLTDWSGSGNFTNWDKTGSGNYYIDSAIDATAPTDPSNPQCRPDSYEDIGETDDDFEIYFTWTNGSDAHSGLATHYCELNDAIPDEDGGNDEQDTDIGSKGMNTYYLIVHDKVGNPSAVVNDTIEITPSIKLRDPTAFWVGLIGILSFTLILVMAIAMIKVFLKELRVV